ncbi:DUF362 domain-containing protein [Candidatus Bathyarchaeota archaeon]|nr:DUF362 domain-containing protein [Candidatus Bathyarchaeota archaeon]
MQIGSVHLETDVDREGFLGLLDALDLKPPVIVKPNWGTSSCFIEAEILDWVLEAVGGEALVVESYGWARSEEALRNEGMGSKKRGDLRRSDEWFLRYSGIGEVLKRHGVEFMNVTEENWGHRTADPEEVRGLVEAKYDPVAMEEMYGFVPERLLEMRGGDLLSLAKLKRWLPPFKASLTVKNFFGMIPGPRRLRYHGKKNSRINQSIADIYKIYESLFDVKGVVEAVLSASVAESLGKVNVHDNPGFASASKQPLELDAVVAALLGLDPHELEYMEHASGIFGEWDEEAVAQARESGIRIL